MARTHQTSTVVINYFSKLTSNLCMLGCCGALLATMGCGKPLAYHFQHYHRPFAAIAKSNQTYFHSGQTGKIIPKDPCASYCEPGCYGYEPTTWTHWPMQCPGKFPVQGESFEEPIENYEGAYYEGVIGAPVVMESVPSQSTPPDPADSSSAPVTPNSSRIGSGVPSPPSISPPSTAPLAIPTDVESSTPSPSDATRLPSSAMPFTRATPVMARPPVGNKVTPPILTPPLSTPPTAPPITLPPVAKPKLNLRSVLSNEKEVNRTVKAATPELPVRVLTADNSSKASKSLASLRRTPPVEGSQSAESLKKIRMTSGQPITGASKSANPRGASLSQKLFTVRELDKAKKITVDKTKITTQPLKQINPPKASGAKSDLPLAKKVVPTSPMKKIEVSKATKATPSGLRLAKKVRPKSAPKLVPSKVAPKVVVPKADVPKVATKVAVPKTAPKVTKAKVAAPKVVATKPKVSNAAKKPVTTTKPVTVNKPVAKTMLKIKEPAAKKPATKKPVKVAMKAAKPNAKTAPKVATLKATKPQKSVTRAFVKKTIRRPRTPRLTPIQLDMSSMHEVKLKSVSQPIIASKSKPLAKSRVVATPKQKQASVVMKAKAEKGDSMLQFAKDPPRRELRVTALPDGGPSIRFK